MLQSNLSHVVMVMTSGTALPVGPGPQWGFVWFLPSKLAWAQTGQGRDPSVMGPGCCGDQPRRGSRGDLLFWVCPPHYSM